MRTPRSLQGRLLALLLSVVLAVWAAARRPRRRRTARYGRARAAALAKRQTLELEPAEQCEVTGSAAGKMRDQERGRGSGSA
ncbi:MAG TPA: hypothetical protein VIN61_05040 [Gammaproteobacteria bacterium]